MKTQFGNILLRRRKELGFTQEYIAKALHLSAQAISKWERGETMPDILLLPALADLLQTSTDELLGHHRQYGKTVYADRYQADEFYWGLEPNEMCYDILRLKPPSQRRLVLDMGCGEGKDAVFLARCGYRAVGFDLAAESIAKAKWLASQYPTAAAEFFRADMLEYVPQQEYDILFASGVLHYLPPERRGAILQEYAARDSRSFSPRVHSVSAHSFDRALISRRSWPRPAVSLRRMRPLSRDSCSSSSQSLTERISCAMSPPPFWILL